MKLMTVVWTAAATAATAAAGGVATDPESAWYRRLRKPDWQPPAIAFPVVWTALYADLAVSSAVALDSNDVPDVPGGGPRSRSPRLPGCPGREPRPQRRVELAVLA